MSNETIHILLVDDNPTDLMIMAEAFKSTQLKPILHAAKNGEDAMAFLRHAHGHVDDPRPDLIILDLNMPRKNGHEVIAEIKSDPVLQRIPVIILTSSLAQEDIDRAYAEHANCYIRKPTDFEDFEKVMALIERFWFETVTLPAKKHAVF
jgi:two-component system, chemotaxis family, response regulator Rcp1